MTIILASAIRMIDCRSSSATKYIYLHSKSFGFYNVLIPKKKRMHNIIAKSGCYSQDNHQCEYWGTWSQWAIAHKINEYNSQDCTPSTYSQTLSMIYTNMLLKHDTYLHTEITMNFYSKYIMWRKCSYTWVIWRLSWFPLRIVILSL